MISSRIAQFTHGTSRGAKRLKLKAKVRFDLFDPVEILPFRGYGTPTRVSIGGRVLETDGVQHRPSSVRDSAFRNLRHSIRRLRSDEIPGAKVRMKLGKLEQEIQTDEEGYFDADIEPDEPLEPGWHDVELELVESIAGSEGVRATGQVLVPPDDADFGVISDVDDTVVYTGVTSRLKMIRIILFKNAHTRLPFPGVAAFYRALKLGPTGRGTNPIFYVSRSPWNLYDLFELFFRAHDIPRGPLFLRDLRFFEGRSRALGKGQDKLTRIRKLFKLYPEMKWVLVGDSGQKDPEIYRDIALEHPGRVRAIYIRDVSKHRRDMRVHAIADDLARHGVPMILITSTDEGAQHAIEAGLIAPDALPDVIIKKREEEQEAAAL